MLRDFIFMDFHEAVKPNTGKCIVGSYWVVTPNDEILFHIKYGGYTPLHNYDANIA